MITKTNTKILISIANKLDSVGEYDLANKIDEVIREASMSPSTLISALKKDDREATMNALTEFIHGVSSHSNPARELGLTTEKLRNFMNAIRQDDLDTARDILGVKIPTKDWENPDVNVYNPVTGLPWSSGPIEPEISGKAKEIIDTVEGVLPEDIDHIEAKITKNGNVRVHISTSASGGDWVLEKVGKGGFVQIEFNKYGIKFSSTGSMLYVLVDYDVVWATVEILVISPDADVIKEIKAYFENKTV